MISVNHKKLWRQIISGEDSELELKSVRFRGDRVSAPRRDSLADEIAAFANASGGRLILGVTDDRQPQPLTPSKLDVLVRYVREICTESIKPVPNVKVLRIPIESSEGDVLLVEIPEGATVHRSPGGYFDRLLDSKRAMEIDDVNRLSRIRGQSDTNSFDSQIVRNAGINTLQRDLWRRYVVSRELDPDDVELRKLKFVKRDTDGHLRATAAGLLLATNDPREWFPNAWIQAVCYSGDQLNADHQIDARNITGPLDDQIRKAVRFVKSNLRVAAYKDPARADVPQFSMRAVFEAVVNAVVHRDYAVRGSRIRLFMFRNKLELYSPGGLCNSMTVDDLRTSQFTRNELLASRLHQCRVGDLQDVGGRRYFVEARGEGVRLIQDRTFSLSGQRANFELISQRELRVRLPAAQPPVAGGIVARISVEYEDTQAPHPDVHVLILYPDKTYIEAHTNAYGHADFVLYSRLPMTVMCAAEGFNAHVERNYMPDAPLEVTLQPVQEGGSQIIPNRSGSLSGIQGYLNPMLDDLERPYLYADSILINEGQSQPVQFILNEPIHLLDTEGNSATLWFREMVGTSCIFDYSYELG